MQRYLFRYIFFNQLDDISTVVANVYLIINDTDISCLVNDECYTIRSIEFFHDAAIKLADGKIGIGKQWKTKRLLLLKFLVRIHVIDADA